MAVVEVNVVVVVVVEIWPWAPLRDKMMAMRLRDLVMVIE